MNQRILQMTDETRVSPNWPFETFKPFASDTAFLQGLEIPFQVAVASQEFDVGFTDDDVIRSRIVMQLLVPFLKEMPTDLLEVMPVHDLEDLVTDTLPVAAAAPQAAPAAAKPAAPKADTKKPDAKKTDAAKGSGK